MFNPTDTNDATRCTEWSREAGRCEEPAVVCPIAERGENQWCRGAADDRNFWGDRDLRFGGKDGLTRFPHEAVLNRASLSPDGIRCGACLQPAYTYSPDFDSAEFRHGSMSAS